MPKRKPKPSFSCALHSRLLPFFAWFLPPFFLVKLSSFFFLFVFPSHHFLHHTPHTSHAMLFSFSRQSRSVFIPLLLLQNCNLSLHISQTLLSLASAFSFFSCFFVVLHDFPCDVIEFVYFSPLFILFVYNCSFIFCGFFVEVF